MSRLRLVVDIVLAPVGRNALLPTSRQTTPLVYVTRRRRRNGHKRRLGHRSHYWLRGDHICRSLETK